MKIRNGFVSNSSSSSFVVLLKSNLKKPIKFNTFLNIVFGRNDYFPDIREVVRPGFNRFIFNREDSGVSEYDEMIHIMGEHNIDPENKFEWYTTQAGDWTGIEEDSINWMRPHGTDSMFKRMIQKGKQEKYLQPDIPDSPPLDTLGLRKKGKTKPKPQRIKSSPKRCACKKRK